MKRPPPYLDQARVLEFAWSDTPFGHVNDTNGDLVAEIHGLALCRYHEDKVIYRFACDANWEVIHDADYESLDAAKERLPAQYRNAPLVWHST